MASQRPELGFREWCSDQATLMNEFKRGERSFISDARFLLTGFQTYVEYHTGNQDSEQKIGAKMKAHKWHSEQLKQLVKIDPSLSSKMRVLFVCVREKDPERLMQVAKKAYGETRLFWSAYEGAYTRNPRAILGEI
jgi:hypothetical protein